MTFLVGAKPGTAALNVAPYRALALQVRGRAVSPLSESEARSQIQLRIAQIGANIGAANGFLGGDVKLVVLPEYFLTGYPMGGTVADWARKGSITPDGVEYEKLGEVAQRNDLFLSGNVYETDPNFPELYFQVSFIIDPSGVLIYRYRRLHSLFSPSPWDVWDKYLDLYGIDGVFPVAKTVIGNLATIASEEILYPELARTFALRGAEVFCHSTSEVGSVGLTPKDVAKRARAYENDAIVVSANSGGLDGSAIPVNSTDGMSKIVDHNGNVLIEAGFGETMVANAIIDVEALRRSRAKPGMTNTLSRTKTQLWASLYGERDIDSANGLTSNPPERAYFLAHQLESIENLSRHTAKNS